jgi:hypothetical protein
MLTVWVPSGEGWRARAGVCRFIVVVLNRWHCQSSDKSRRHIGVQGANAPMENHTTLRRATSVHFLRFALGAGSSVVPSRNWAAPAT